MQADSSTRRDPSAFELQSMEFAPPPSTVPARVSSSKRKKTQNSIGDGRQFSSICGDRKESTSFEVD